MIEEILSGLMGELAGLVWLPLLVYGIGTLLIVYNEGSWISIAVGILWMAGGTVGIVFWIIKKIKKRGSK